MAADIRWSGERSCRRELEVAEQIESMTGRAISSIDSVDFELGVRSLASNQWGVELTTVRRADGVRSTRAIHGATCAEVTDAAAVAIALAIGPVESRSEPGNEPKPATQPASAKADESARPASNAPSTRSRLEWIAALAANLDSSATPSLALGASVHFGLNWRPTDESQTALRFELEGALYAPTETSSVAGKRGNFSLPMWRRCSAQPSPSAERRCSLVLAPNSVSFPEKESVTR
jgi:hypothetical protein